MDQIIQDNIVKKWNNHKNRSYSENSINRMLTALNSDKLKDVNVKKLSSRMYELSEILDGLINSYMCGKKYTNPNLSDEQIQDLYGRLDKKRKSIDQIEDKCKAMYGGKKLYKLVDDNEVKQCVQVGGFFLSMPGASRTTQILDMLQLIIDIAGFIPGAGIIIDSIGLVMSLLRRDWFGAICSAINIIPIVGSFIGTPVKYIDRYMEIVDAGRKASKVAHNMGVYPHHPMGPLMGPPGPPMGPPGPPMGPPMGPPGPQRY